MCAAREGPGSVLKKESSPSPDDPILFVGMCLVLGMVSRHFLRGTIVPYTVALLLLGIGLGALEFGTHSGLGKLGASIRAWVHINPNLILFTFLPPLLFESSFAIEIHQFKRCFVQMVLLAGPGVVISTFSIGTAIHFFFPYDWEWKISLLLGGLLSATDPVAVVALLKELGANKKLNTIIEGESLMNDGIAIVVYRLFFQMVLGHPFNVGKVIIFLSRVTLGAVALGLAFGLVSFLWLGVIFNDAVMEITLTLSTTYLAYFTAESGAEVSGILTVMTLGLVYAASRTVFKNESWQRTTFKSETQQSLYHFWETVSYIANTLVFIFSGVVIAESILQNQNDITGQSWGLLILLYVLVQVSRVLVVVVLYPGLRYFGYGLNWKETIILIWSGLRGVVALALSLILNRESLHIPQLTQETGALMRIVHHIKSKMYNKALEKFEELREDEESRQDDQPSVFQYITCLGRRERGVNVNEQQRMGTQDTRLLLLNGVQAAYWRMLCERKITQPAAIFLMRSIDEAIDMVDSRERLLDWEVLEARVKFADHFKCLQMRCLPQKLATFFDVAQLRLACYICAAFLRAHKIARRQLRNAIGDNNVAEYVIRESEEEGEPPMQFLQEVQYKFPQVLCEIRTKSVAYSILLHLSEYVQNLKKSGLLEAKEMDQLHEAIEMDVKRILGKESFVKNFRSFFHILKQGVTYGRNNENQLGESTSRPTLAQNTSILISLLN